MNSESKWKKALFKSINSEQEKSKNNNIIRYTTKMLKKKEKLQPKGLQQNGVANFSGCNLTHIPQEIFSWISKDMVKDLDLSNNEIINIPPPLRAIKRVNLSGNPLLGLPLELRKAKWSKVQNYLNFVQEKANNWNFRKIIFVGEEAVGKSVTKLSFFSISCFSNFLTRNY